MFEVGAYIMYGRSGVCKVREVGKPQLSGMDMDRLYYTLEPLYGSETIFIPVDAKVCMRPILSRQEAEEMLEQIPALLDRYREEIPVLEQRELANYYKSLLETGEFLDTLRLLAYIGVKRNNAEKGGKKLCQTDKVYGSKAEELIYGELAIALELEWEQLQERLPLR